MVALVQRDADERLGRLAGDWSRTLAPLQQREGVAPEARQRAIDAAAAPVARTEGEIRADVARALDAVAERLVRARRQLLDMVAARVAAARAAQRVRAPERLSAIAETHFESAAPGAAPSSSFDTTIASAQVRLRPVVLRAQAQALGLAERVHGLTAARAVATPPANRLAPEPPPRPRILSVAVLRGPDEYPFMDGSGPDTKQWTLFVLGRDLLRTKDGQPVAGIHYVRPVRDFELRGAPREALGFGPDTHVPRIDGDGGHVFYHARLTAHGPAEAKRDPLLVEGFDRTAFGFDLDTPGGLSSLEGLVVVASVKANVPPGYQPIQIGPARAEWFLRTGTHQGTLRFLRIVSVPRNEHDDLQHVVMPDTVQLELTLEQPVSEPEARLVIYRNGVIVDFGLQDEVLVARRVPGNPRVYRTEPIRIHEEGRAHPDQGSPGRGITVRSGYTLVAMVVDPWFRATPVDRVTVYATPAEGRIYGVSALWKDALAEAARLWGRRIEDWNTLTLDGADSITSVYVFQLDWHTVRFTIADHAAMLLLRRQFLDMAHEQKAQLQRILADDELLWGYYWTLQPLMSLVVARPSTPFPLARVPVPESGAPLQRPGPDGTLRPFPPSTPTEPWVRAFDLWYLRQRFRSFPVSQYEWQKTAMRYGVAKQLEWIDRAIARAQAIDAKDLAALVNLTGDSYEPVIERVRPLMLTLTDVKDASGAPVAFRWEPDQAARDALTRVRTIMAELAAARKAARADTEALLAASVLALGNPSALLSKVILAAASLGSVATAVADIQAIAGYEAEREFARGAVPVIGFDRLNAAEAQRVVPSWVPYATLFASVIGFRMDMGDLVQAIRLSQAYRLAERTADAVVQAGARAMRDASEQELRAFLVAAEDSRLTRELAAESGRAVTPAQSKILAAVDRVEADIAMGSRLTADGPPAHWSAGTERYTAQEVAAARREASRLFVELESSGGAGLSRLSPQDQRSLFIAIDEAESARAAGKLTAEHEQVLKGRDSLAAKAAAQGVDPQAVLPIRGSTLDLGSTSALRPPSARAARPARPIEPNPGMPYGDTTFTLPGTTKSFRLGPLRGKGAYAHVYDYPDLPGHVIKLVSHDPQRRGTLAEVLRRMQDGADAIAPHAASIPQLRTISVQQYGDFGVVIQEALPTGPTGWKLFRAIPEQAAYEAGFELMMELRRKGLAWWDCHFNNMFFIPQPNGRFVAGILDPDMIMRPGQAAGGLDMSQRLTAIEDFGGATVLHDAKVIASLDDTQRSMNAVFDVLEGPLDPQRAMRWNIDEFTVHMLEFRGYIRFHRFSERALRSGTTTRRGLWRSGWIDLQRVENAMGGNLDHFPTYGDRFRAQPPPGLQPPPPPPPGPRRSWLWPARDVLPVAA